jgi:hypothetical protein
MFTIGADPEFMVTDAGGAIRSAIGVVGASKSNRIQQNGHEFYYDNVFAEIALKPAASMDGFVSNLQEAICLLKDRIGDNRLICRSAYSFPKSELTHPAAMEGGCKEEFCAYTLMPKVVQDSWFVKNQLRVAGGHIHIGTNLIENEIDRQLMVRMFDLFLGVPSIYLDKDSTSIKRRKLYGKAGRYRDPDYGVEYRTLGNFWLSSPKLAKLVYELVEFTLEFFSKGRHHDLWEVDYDALEDDENYNTPGWTPAKAHECTGYDVNALREVINSGKDPNGTFMEFVFDFMPKRLKNKVEKAITFNQLELEKEW